ncbi:c-type cytochrome [Pandoraea pneumonica]
MAKLMKKVKQGGSGVWGPMAMPPNPGISDVDLKVVLTWILAGAPQQ